MPAAEYLKASEWVLAAFSRLLQNVTSFFEEQRELWEQTAKGAMDRKLARLSQFRLILLSRETPSCLTDYLAGGPHIQLEIAQMGKKTKPKDTATKPAPNGKAKIAQKLSAAAIVMLHKKKMAAAEESKVASSSHGTIAGSLASQEGQSLPDGPATKEGVAQELAKLSIANSASSTHGRQGEAAAVELAANSVFKHPSATLESEEYEFDPTVDSDDVTVVGEILTSEADLDAATLQGGEGEADIEDEDDDDGPLQNLALCHYIEAKVEELSKIRPHSNDVERTISSSLQEKGDGSFLWIDLAVEELLLHDTDNVAQAAQQLPSSVNELYCCALRRILEHTVPLVVALFRWVLAALRPMSITEISTALVQMGFATPSPIEMVKYGVAACSSMLGINEETDEVHILHTSVQDFLTEKTGPLWTDSALHRFHVNVEDFDSDIASVCIRYLEQGCLHAGPITVADGDRYWQRVDQFPLLPYASVYWSDHLRTATRPHIDISSPFFADQSPIRKNWWQSFYPSTTGKNPMLTPRSYGVLHMAACLNLVSVAQQLELRGELHRRMNNKDSHGSSPLHWAVVMGNMDMFAFLLQRGASRECVGETIFELACRKGQQEIVEYLLNMGQDVNARAADPITAKGISQATRWIHGKVHDGQILETDFWKLLVRDTGAGGTALHTSCLSGHTSVAELLVSRGAHVQITTTKGWTALHSASWRGQMDCVKLLLDHGAHPLEVTLDGWNSLHCAASRGKHTVVSFYLSKGIPVDVITNKRKTSLHHAAYFGSAATVSVLIQAGAYIDAQSQKGETPLHLAARAGEPEVVELLLSMGANRHMLSNAGKTPAEALRHIWTGLVASQKEALRILDQYGLPGYSPWKPEEDPKATTAAQTGADKTPLLAPAAPNLPTFTTTWQFSATASTGTYTGEVSHPARSKTAPLAFCPTPGVERTSTFGAPPPYTPSEASAAAPQEKYQQPVRASPTPPQHVGPFATGSPTPTSSPAQGVPWVNSQPQAPANTNTNQAFWQPPQAPQQASQLPPNQVPAPSQWAAPQPSKLPPYNPPQAQYGIPPASQATTSPGTVPHAYPFPTPTPQQSPTCTPPMQWKPPVSSPLVTQSPGVYPPSPLPQQPAPSYSAYPPPQHSYSAGQQHPQFQVQQPHYPQTQAPLPYAYPPHVQPQLQSATTTSAFLSASGYAPTGGWMGQQQAGVGQVMGFAPPQSFTGGMGVVGQPLGYPYAGAGVPSLQKKKSIFSLGGIEITRK